MGQHRMTRQKLEQRLDLDAEDGSSNYFRWGTVVEAGVESVGLILVRQSRQEPCSVYTSVEMPDGMENLGLTELWEVEWRSVYQVMVAEYALRPLQPGEDPRDFPQVEDYLRCESFTVRDLDAVEDILGRSGKSLADVGPIDVSHVPLVAAV